MGISQMGNQETDAERTERSARRGGPAGSAERDVQSGRRPVPTAGAAGVGGGGGGSSRGWSSRAAALTPGCSLENPDASTAWRFHFGRSGVSEAWAFL